MEPVTTTSSTVVSPVVLVAGGIVIGATAATVAIKYQKEIKAAGVAVTDKAKSLFGKKAAPAAIEAPVVAVVEAPVAVEAPVVVEAPVAVEVPVVVEAPVAVEAPAAIEAPVVAVVEAPVAVEAPVVVAETTITVEQVESVAKLAELLSPSLTAVATEAAIGSDLTVKVLSASITEDNKVSDVVLLTQEVAAGIAEAMTQLPQQQRVQQPYRQHGKRHHQRR